MSLDQARTFADLANYRGKHRRRGRAETDKNYAPKHAATHHATVDIDRPAYVAGQVFDVYVVACGCGWETRTDSFLDGDRLCAEHVAENEVAA